MRKTKAEKRAEEEKIIAEMEEAMRELNASKTEEELSAEESRSDADGENPKGSHCPKCGKVTDKGSCPSCGFRAYQPMDERTVKRVRLIVGGVLILAFIIFMIVKG
ncbi:MAG: hypothetical protein IKZ28_02625 [Clostridia bacterium]|nr:hypothetical protein [Clostridia bacterium]